MFAKYLQNLLAISIGSVNVLPSDLNHVGRDDLLLRLLIGQVISDILKLGVAVFSFGNAKRMGEFVFVGFILRLRRCGRWCDEVFVEYVFLVNGFQKSRAKPWRKKLAHLFTFENL